MADGSGLHLAPLWGWPGVGVPVDHAEALVDTVLAKGNYTELDQITLLLIATFLARSVFYYFQVYYLSFVGERVVVDLRSEVYTQLHRLSLRFYNDRRVGELISRLLIGCHPGAHSPHQ